MSATLIIALYSLLNLVNFKFNCRREKGRSSTTIEVLLVEERPVSLRAKK